MRLTDDGNDVTSEAGGNLLQDVANLPDILVGGGVCVHDGRLVEGSDASRGSRSKSMDEQSDRTRKTGCGAKAMDNE